MAYVLARADALSVLRLPVEGNGLRSIRRLTGVHRDTAARLTARAGERLRGATDRRFRNPALSRLQCDEIWTFVRKKQGRLRPEERDDAALGGQYLFVAPDEETKPVPSFVPGKRNTANTLALMHDPAGRLVVPPLFAPGPRPMPGADGWRAYPGAVDRASGGAVNHGTLIKDYTGSERPGRCGPPIATGATRTAIQGALDRPEIRTSHVERRNLSIRTSPRRFTRPALGFSKKLGNLAAAVSLYVARYNFCRMHGSLPGTPATAAGVAGHPWAMEERYEAE